MAFIGWDPRMMQETLRQGYLDRNEIARQQRANDAQDLHNVITAQEASKSGLFDNNPEMQRALGISKTPYLDPRDLGYNPAGTYGAPQPQQQSNGTLGQATPQSDNPVPKMVGGYNFPTQEQQDTPQMPSPGPYASGYVNAPPPRPATTGMSQPGPWAPTVDPAAAATSPAQPKSYTQQTLEKLSQLFPGQVDLASGTMNASLRDMIEKNQAQQAQLQSLQLQNQFKYGTALTEAQMRAAAQGQVADTAAAARKYAADQSAAARKYAADHQRSAQPKSAAGSLTGGKDPVLDAAYATQKMLLNNYTKGDAALLQTDNAKAIQANMAALEQQASGGMPNAPTSSSPAPGVNAAPPGKGFDHWEYSQSRNQSRPVDANGNPVGPAVNGKR